MCPSRLIEDDSAESRESFDSTRSTSFDVVDGTAVNTLANVSPLTLPLSANRTGQVNGVGDHHHHQASPTAASSSTMPNMDVSQMLVRYLVIVAS